MGYTMKEAENLKANIVTNPVLEYLKTKNPSREYYAVDCSVGIDIIVEIIKIKEKRARLGIFPRTIAKIEHGVGSNSSTFKTYNKKIISTHKLLDLMQGVDVRGICLSSAFHADKAFDYP